MSDLRGLSESLVGFVAEAPWERGSILSFVRGAAERTPSGARVLDVGAGNAPYRELFSHADYRTTDWEQSLHTDAAVADYVASADALPVQDEEFDVVLCTQVLEHVREPAAVLREIARVLRPSGRLYLTAPLAWELHELPHDYYRYTQPGLAYLLEATGFVDVDVRPRNDYFTTLAQLMRNAGATIGRAPDGLDERREDAGRTLAELADRVAELAPLDTRWVLPLGYSATASTRPA